MGQFLRIKCNLKNHTDVIGQYCKRIFTIIGCETCILLCKYLDVCMCMYEIVCLQTPLFFFFRWTFPAELGITWMPAISYVPRVLKGENTSVLFGGPLSL